VSGVDTKYDALVVGSVFVACGAGCLCYHWNQDPPLVFGIAIFAAVGFFVLIYAVGFRGFKQ
jgi:hypothetical protein